MEFMAGKIRHRSEKTAADYLIKQGYDIIDHNVRCKQYEVDIIATKDRVVYLIEVKYRKNLYIMPNLKKKLYYYGQFAKLYCPDRPVDMLVLLITPSNINIIYT